MPTETFSGHTLTKIKTLMKKGVASLVIYKDQDESGLAVKVTKTGASWYFSTRADNRVIAPFAQYGLADLPSLRSFVKELKIARSQGREIDTLIKAFAAGHSLSDAKNLHAVQHGDAVAWETGRDLYLEWAARNRNKDTVRGYRSALGSAGLADDFKPIHGKPLPSITTADLATIRNNVIARGLSGDAKGEGIRQANLTVSAIKSAFKYFVNNPQFGIEKSPAESLSKALERPTTLSISRQKRALMQEEIGALAYAIEAIPNEQARLVLQLQLLLGQRRFTVVSAKRSAFDLHHPHYDVVWNFEDKSHHFRALPLSGGAGELVRKAMRLSENNEHSPYLFPQQRPGKDGRMDGHLNERTVSAKLEELRKPGGIFEKMPFNVATHDLRKAFTSVMRPRMSNYKLGERQLVEDDIEMITHADEGRDRTSSLVYDRNQYLDVKLKILGDWADYIWKGYEAYGIKPHTKKAA